MKRVWFFGLGLVLGLVFFVCPVYADKALRMTPTSTTSQLVWFGSYYNTTGVHDSQLVVGGWGDMYVTLVRYDLSPMPLVAKEAAFWFYYYPAEDASTPTPIKWYKLLAQWDTKTVGWSTLPLVSYLGFTPSPLTEGLYSVNVTTWYNQWRKGIGSDLNYGMVMAPYYNNNRFDLFVSAAGIVEERPYLRVVYADPVASDYIIHLKWPLASPSYGSRVVNQAFGVNWSFVSDCPAGVRKKHNGIDFRATAGTTVYAPEDGIVKEILDFNALWAQNIVIEHNKPLSSNKFTTVSWHVNPIAGLKVGMFVPKGMKIATVANLGGNTHFHFGVRYGSYVSKLSGTGALPTTNCGGYLAFPSGFIDLNKTTNVIFQ